MLKRFTNFFAWLLLVLMPLQALATANMLVCNTMMQLDASRQMADKQMADKQIVKEMPCHQHASNIVSNSVSNSLSSKESHQAKQPQNQPPACKANCATVCANWCALTALSQHTNPFFTIFNSQVYNFNHQIYTSITQASLQRPPNYFI